HQEADGRAHRPAHRAAARPDRARLRPRPVVHRGGGQGLRVRGPGVHSRGAGRARERRGRRAADRRREHERRQQVTGINYAPQGRYILPQFEERTSYGMKRLDPYTKMFEDRIIFLGVQVDDASADDITAQLIVLESQDPDRDILLYINSPGGSFTALTAIYDTMQYVRPDIQTVCLGQAASA